MPELLTIFISILTAITLTVAVLCFIFYKKSEVDDKDKAIKEELEDKIDKLNNEIVNNKLEHQKDASSVRQEINDKLSENKKALEDGMKQFIDILSDIKQADKDMSIQFITMINTVKEELKNDYTSRYNDLLLLINTKANEKDFNRLEAKFDKVAETMVELKTIVQLQMEDKKEH